ncbi:MAG: hypothetical protein COB23_08720 [Methylophaga sp.]|nr:MAG: hypothetical protein COB23_08720 [Methylophaga sp.]
MKGEKTYRYLDNIDSFNLPVSDTVPLEEKSFDRDGNKTTVGSNAYCLGIEITTNNDQQVLSNKNYWDIGIP